MSCNDLTFLLVRGKIPQHSSRNLTVKCQKLFSIIPDSNAWEHVDRFYVNICFEFYALRPDILDAKYGGHQKKQFWELVKKKKIFFCYFVVLSKKNIKAFWRKISISYLPLCIVLSPKIRQSTHALTGNM